MPVSISCMCVYMVCFCASSSVHIARQLADQNGFAGVVEVIQGKIEDVTLPQKVGMEPRISADTTTHHSNNNSKDRFITPHTIPPQPLHSVKQPHGATTTATLSHCQYYVLYIHLQLTMYANNASIAHYPTLLPFYLTLLVASKDLP